jgi:hypothetical protein
LQLLFNLNEVGTLRFYELTPMKQLGVNVKPMKFKYGNQFQDWAKINIPVIDSIFGIPDLVVNETVMFLPPMSNNPTLKMAPILAMIST